MTTKNKTDVKTVLDYSDKLRFENNNIYNSEELSDIRILNYLYQILIIIIKYI